MNQKEKRKLETQLIAEGLAPLNDPELIEQLANLVSNWPGDKHDYMRDLINECEPENRYEMYHAIAPKLRFKALSLDQYLAQIALKAGEMISQGRMKVEGVAPPPIVIGEQKLAIVPRSEATGALATVRCHRCPKVDRFHHETPAGAMIEARKAGWTREKGVNKETCPKCSEALAATVVRLANGTELPVYDRRACKLDA
jgi:hypothetical protein